MQSQVRKKPTKKNSAAAKKHPSRARKLIPIEDYAKSIRAEDFKNDPFFKKKADDAQAFLEKHPFPKELLPKK
jgi:hypothetical protein